MCKISPDTEIDEIHVTGQKEVRIIDVLEPLMNQHRLIVDKTTLDKDFDTTIVYSFTNQLTTITKERGCLRHDDRLDSLANAVLYMLDKMSDDEEFGMGVNAEREAERILEETEALFQGYDNPWEYGDYASNY